MCVLELKEVNSTNSYAMKGIADFEDKTVIIADKQTDGHGRFNRKWISDIPENLYMSIVLKPSNKLSKDLPIANLTQYLSVVIIDTLEDYGIDAAIKWPNDVLVDGKKISGILCESSVKGDKLNGVVLGAGINLNLEKNILAQIDQPATALNLELGRAVDKKEFSDKLLKNFFECYDEFMAQGFNYIKDKYTKRCGFIGKEVTVKNPGNIQTGIAEKINEDGSLLLKTKDEESIIMIGDIIC